MNVFIFGGRCTESALWQPVGLNTSSPDLITPKAERILPSLLTNKDYLRNRFGRVPFGGGNAPAIRRGTSSEAIGSSVSKSRTSRRGGGIHAFPWLSALRVGIDAATRSRRLSCRAVGDPRRG